MVNFSAKDRYQYVDAFHIRAGDSLTTLNFDEAFIIGTGVRFRF